MNEPIKPSLIYNELNDELQLYRDLVEAETDIREERASLASET